jgi:hypothetical protein
LCLCVSVVKAGTALAVADCRFSNFDFRISTFEVAVGKLRRERRIFL